MELTNLTTSYNNDKITIKFDITFYIGSGDITKLQQDILHFVEPLQNEEVTNNCIPAGKPIKDSEFLYQRLEEFIKTSIIPYTKLDKLSLFENLFEICEMWEDRELEIIICLTHQNENKKKLFTVENKLLLSY